MILLIGGASLSASPYIYSYIEILEKNAIPYDFIFWNRDMHDIANYPTNFFPYNKLCDNSIPRYRRICPMIHFKSFVKQQMKGKDYDAIIVFTIGTAFIIQNILKKYKGKYILDIRDHSPICKYDFFNRVKKMIYNSSFTSISSHGFLEWLPKLSVNKYVVTHNTRKDLILKGLDSIEEDCTIDINNLKILTIGQIRDFSTNVMLLSQLKNNPAITMLYAGYGATEQKLHLYATEQNVGNAFFVGRYKKEEEEDIVKKCDMINAMTGHDINSDSLMSNRFYLSVLYGKPMLVTENTYQAKLVKQYGLGVVIGKEKGLYSSIISYCNNFDQYNYYRGRREFLRKALNDIFIFESKILDTINKFL